VILHNERFDRLIHYQCAMSERELAMHGDKIGWKAGRHRGGR
jgi:hypothetical protein